MKNLSRRMKRLLAILLVETIVAVNVISGYASESDGVYTISEAEVEAELQESGNDPVVTQEEVSDDSQDSYDESYEEQEDSYQEQEIQQEDQNAFSEEEGDSKENADSVEQPVAEEPSLSDENNEEQTDGEAEEQEPEEQEEQECICTIDCQYDDFEYINKDCPICAKAIDIEDDEQRELYLAKKCEVLKEKLAHATPTPTIAPTATIMPTATVTPTATITPTETPKETNKPEETSAPETTASAAPTESVAPTESASPSEVPEVTPSADPGESPDVSPSELPNGTPEIGPSVSPSALSSASPSMIPSASPSESPLKEESGIVTLKGKVTQKASRWIFSKTVNMSYTITVENTSDTDATDICVEAAIPSIITINDSNTGWIIYSLPAGEKAEISFDGYINENTDNVDSLMGRFYINGEKIEDVSFDGEWRLIESDSTEGPTSISTSCDGVTINVSAADGSILPAGVEVKATRISADSAVNLIEQSQGVEVLDAMAFDIVLVVDGQEVQPDGSVVVTFTDIPLASEDYAVAVAHIGDSGIENIGTGDKSSVSVEADHFSEYVLYTIKKVSGSYVPSNGVTTKDNENMACFDFHIFANYYSGNYNGHVNGNFAIRNIEGDTMATFGLNNGDKVSENQQICYVENMSAWNETVKNYSHTTFVFGPGIELKVYGGNIYAVQNGKEFCIGSYASMKDQVFTSDIQYVDFAEEFRKAEAYSKELSEKENDTATSITGDNNHRYIDSASDVDEVYITMTPGDMGVQMDFNASKSGQKFIINVVVDGDEFVWNSNGISYKVNGVGDIGNSESHAFYAGNIIWNFVKPDGSPFDGKITLTGTWLGTIMAPKATVSFTVVNGSVIADRVYKGDGESHKGTYTTTKADYTVYKSWSGGTNRPDVNVSLYRRIRNADSSFVAASIDRNNLSDTSAYELVATATIRCSAGESSYTFAKLPSSDEYGYTNEYFVVEEPTPGYEASYNGPLSIVNEYVQQETGGITLNKTNQFGTTIEGVVFGIYSDEAATVKVGEMTTNASGTASYAELEPGTYYVKEISAPEGYQISDTVYSVVVKANEVARVNGGEAIVNEQKMGGLTLKKVNEIGENLAGAVFTIYSDADTTTVVGTMTTDAEGNASYNDLAAGVYYVKETSAPEGYKLNPVIYTVVVTADSITAVNDGNAIVNEERDQYTDYSVNKIWVGSLKRSVTVQLMRNGEPASDVNDYRVTLGADGEQSYTWSRLLSKSNGVTYTYSVVEIDSNGNAYKDGDFTNDSCRVSYATGESSTTITNTYEAVQISGTKTWEDNENQDGARPEKIVINLLTNGVKTDSQEVTGPNWTWKFDNLPKYADGNEIVYTITEDAVEGYTTTVNGYDITNTHTPGKTSHSVKKVWDDSDNQDGIRPGSIKVVLVADGSAVDGSEVVLNESNGWEHTWTDLAEKKNGNQIQYTAKEVGEISGYEVAGTTSGTTTVITNTHHTEKIEVSGSKTWDDSDDQDGLRVKISSITIRLWNGETEVASQEVTEADGWTWKFDNLPKYADGKEIKYTITEDPVEGYTPSVNGYNVTNTHTPEVVEISGSKTWEDNNNQDGARPEKIVINLFANGEKVGSREATAPTWSWDFGKLPKYADGSEIVYTITEDAVEGYTATVNGYDITNSHTPGKTSHSVEKVWNDSNNQDGIRPGSIRVVLVADGNTVDGSEVTLNESNDWRYTWTDLAEKKDGKQIQYTAEEVGKFSGYEVSGTTSGTTTIITNTHDAETVEISGSKTWDDSNDQDGLRAKITSITIHLWNGSTEVASQKVTAADGWKWKFEDLPKYADGKEIRYTITEDPVEGYTSSVDGYDVTNTHTPETIEISGSKTWDDSNDQDGLRAKITSITIRLWNGNTEVASQKATAENGWSWKFVNLPKYADGKEITYTITEDKVEGYTSSINGYDVMNSHTPELVDFRGTKTWEDNNNQDGIRPVSIKVRLLANGVQVAEKEVTAADGWNWKFEGFPKYKDGKEIGYTITEDAVVGYTSEVNQFDITNTHTPEKVKITGTKSWQDNDDQDGIRPKTITINLFADGVQIASKTVGSADNWSWTFDQLDKYKGGKEIKYTITEDEVKDYSTVITETGNYEYEVVNSYTPGKTSKTVTKIWEDNHNQDGIRPASIQVVLLADGQKANVADAQVTLDASNNWTYTWNDLDLKANRKTIQYTVKEIGTMEGYDTSYSEDTFTITNTHTPAKVYVEGTKTWEDINNQDGIRPESIIVKLYADGELKDSKEVTAADGWSWRFDNLPKFKNVDGTAVKIQYSVQEEAVTGYNTTYPAGSFDIVNSHTPEKISLDGIKTWEDNNDQDGIRPESITVKLLADGKDTGKRATATEADGWKYSFTDLDKYKENGTEIKYTVEEVTVDGYTTTVSGTTITNSHTPEKTSLEGTKVWNDAENQDGKRPESIIIRLYADGEEIASKTLTADANEGNTWNWSFIDLDKKKDGRDIVYTVTEDVVMGYATTIDGTTITNTYKPEMTQISGTKTWLDSNNQDGKRPDSITINLLADGKFKLSTTTDAAANWAYSFTDLPAYENGHKITYTIEEVVPEGYTVSYDGNNITNKYDPEKTSVNGVKTWNDNADQDGKRPESITVHLYADGVDTGKEVTTDESKNWKYSFEDLDKYKDGVEIVYTVVEDEVKDYTTSIDGYNITNTHTPETTKVEGSKTWNDAENQDNVRPEKIIIRLYADGKEIQHREVTAGENWKWSFTDLPKYADGTEIIYTISEDPVDDYTTEVKDYDVTNTHKPAVVEIQGIKTWNDNDDQDGKRPTEIIVRLYADGTEVESKTVTERSGWIYRFTNLPKYAEGQQGQEIIYTVREDVVEGYSTEYTEGSYDITNSYTPEETSRTVTKIWEDEENQDGLRPTSIMVQLMADQKPYGDPVELNEANNWTYTWTKLPVKEKKNEITYAVEEISKIEGYDTTYSDDTFMIINTHKPAEVFVEGTKTWDDEDNQDGLRPTSITINLLADGEQIDSMVVTPAADGTWSWRFDNLPKFKNVNGTVTKIQYSIEEIKVDGYESQKDYTNDRFNLINTHKPETVDLSGSKTWNDNDNVDGLRPSSIKISLLADGTVVAEKTVTEADGWSWSFTDLPKYADGKEIRYTVSEDVVDGYTTSYSEDGLSVINSYTPELTGRSVVKIWDDSNNADQIRPVSIQVQLLADGAAYGDAVTLSDGNNWSYTWSDLPAKKNGQDVVYTVQEITSVNGYTVSISESGTVFTIVNYHPVTPPPTPTPTPSDEPTPTPSDGPSTTPEVTPSSPTSTPPTGEVLGARRGGAVLGARRGLDQAVLGKRRRPSTGDSAAMIIWVIALFGAMGGAAASIVGLKKKDDKK